ncbi:MAG: oxidoreductase [Flammeovirgaceae bacterium TMED32]|nr:MAG: oxidoreductase [Flammeovirgaceae bacterium TMED32]|tara:strand:+ start:960 stop:1868 length:909 start_codon:yes stop_codon:yes gene_type:complete
MSLNKIKLTTDFSLSRIIHGLWRLEDWNLDKKDLVAFLEEIMEMGITSFDHADIYGDYSCEKIFGDALRLQPSLRKDMQIITKCGIKLRSNKYPERKLQIYDYSYQHILQSAEQSLQNLGIDTIDLLLLHRPAPFFDPEEVIRAFDALYQAGKVRYFGVSNFTPRQFEMLQKHWHQKLLTNQIEISPGCLEHFENGNLDFCLKEQIRPMSWSPLSGGELFHPTSTKGIRILKVLEKITEGIGAKSIDQVVYAWIVKHPSQIMPVVGSGKIERIQTALDGLELELSMEQWYEIYNASTGVELP